jgi:hypothetical protein
MMDSDLIAPCGMNCAICVGYFGYTMGGERRKMVCPGCLPKNKVCAFIKRRCDLLKNGEVRFCYECDDFPCTNLTKLDKRYRKRFNYSTIDNLKFIQTNGMKEFLKEQAKTYKCPECSGTVCVHTNLCYTCSPPTSILSE